MSTTWCSSASRLSIRLSFVQSKHSMDLIIFSIVAGVDFEATGLDVPTAGRFAGI